MPPSTEHSSGIQLLWKPSVTVFLLLVAASIFYMIGFFCTGWTSSEVVLGELTGWYVYWGVWDTCACSSSTKFDEVITITKAGRQVFFADSVLHTVRAMTTIGLIGLLCALVLIILIIFVNNSKMNKNLLGIILVALCFAAVVFMLIGLAVFGVKSHSPPKGAFAMTVIGAILTFAAGIMCLVRMVLTK